MKFLQIFAIQLFAALGHYGADKPNIILILADDMPWWGTSVAQEEGNPQSTSIYRDTPHIERIAQSGMTFSNAYAAAGMCAPSRTSIQTGLSPARHLFSGNGNFGEDCPPEVSYEVTKKKARKELLIEPSPLGSLNPKFLTIGEVLQQQGYATAHIGKWHVYGGGPELHGYDLSDGETSNSEGGPQSGIAADDPKRIFSITEKSIDFIEEQHAEGRPFYVQLSHYVEHNKQMSLPETLEKFEQKDVVQSIDNRRYNKEVVTHGSAVKDLDTSIGMLLDRLDELGIRDNTYIIFTSDNGKDLFNGTESVLRGDKWWLWEAGVRVPFMVEGPGIKPGSRTSVNTANYDLMPTFYEIAGGNASDLENKVDGESLLPVFAQEDGPEFQERALFFHYPHLRNSTPHSAIIKGDYKLYTFYEIPDEPYLFDLSNDLGETTNLTPRMPERAEAMKQELFNYFDHVGAYLPKVNPDADSSKEPFNPDKRVPSIGSKGKS